MAKSRSSSTEETAAAEFVQVGAIPSATVEQTVREAEAQGFEYVAPAGIEKWETGREITATYLATREGGYEDSVLLDLLHDGTDGDNEQHSWSCPTVLRNRLSQARVQAGDRVKIVCAGKETFKSGSEGWNFLVFVARKKGGRK
jgi:hypothetical protein